MGLFRKKNTDREKLKKILEKIFEKLYSKTKALAVTILKLNVIFRSTLFNIKIFAETIIEIFY